MEGGGPITRLQLIGHGGGTGPRRCRSPPSEPEGVLMIPINHIHILCQLLSTKTCLKCMLKFKNNHSGEIKKFHK